jgi:hypothetical protein
MRRLWFKRAPVGIAILLSILSFCCIAYAVGMRVASELWLTGVDRAAHRVGVEPTLNGIAEYIVNAVQVGMQREQVEETLRSVAPIRVMRGDIDERVDIGWGPTACDHIWLELTPLPGHEWPMVACYDHENRLVLLKSRDPDFPPLGISAPISQ